MKENLKYYREDIEKWLKENHMNVQTSDSDKEFARNALKYHNSSKCENRCRCYDENNQCLTPKVPVPNRKWFKQVIEDKLDFIWRCNRTIFSYYNDYDKKTR